MKRKKIYLSYDKIEHWLRSQSIPLRKCNAVSVIGILRGGYFPAILVSHIVGAPVSFLRYDRATGLIDPTTVKLPPAGSRVFLCEDIAGSGITLLSCRDFLLEKGLDVVIVTIIKDDHSRITPNFAIDIGSARGILPWERHVGTHRYVEQTASLTDGVGLRGHDHEYEAWGFDLDGVFLEDVSTDMYENDLEAALKYRSDLPPNLKALQFSLPYAIITGRPEQDRAITETWLKKHCIPYVHLFMRDPKEYSDKETAKYKAAIASDLELTHFVESDPAQAVEIASLLPWSQVMRWDIECERAVLLSVQELST